jgi:hypothetical protein
MRREMRRPVAASTKDAWAKHEAGRSSAHAVPAPQPVFDPPVIVQRKCAWGGGWPSCEKERRLESDPSIQTHSVVSVPFAFGAIDCFNWQIASDGMVHVWLKDRYEWHPEDTSRPSNCVHIAVVELKSSGAADYWMEADALLPMSAITVP